MSLLNYYVVSENVFFNTHVSRALIVHSSVRRDTRIALVSLFFKNNGLKLTMTSANITKSLNL